MIRLRTLLLLTVLLGTGRGAAWAQFERGMVVSGFRVPDYDENGQLKTQIFGAQAHALSEHVVDITGLRIETFQDGEVDMRVVAPHCRFDQRTGVATSDGDVRITRSNVILSGRGFRWESEPTRFELHRNARVVFRGARSRNSTGERKKP